MKFITSWPNGSHPSIFRDDLLKNTCVCVNNKDLYDNEVYITLFNDYIYVNTLAQQLIDFEEIVDYYTQFFTEIRNI